MRVASALLLRRVAAVALLLAASARPSRGDGCPALGCDDGNLCNGVETCDSSTGQCVAGVPPSCDDGDDCTFDTCVPATGCVSSRAPNYLACRARPIVESLEAARQAIRAAPPRAVGGVATARKLRRLLTDALAALSPPECRQTLHCLPPACRCSTDPRRLLHRLWRDLGLYCTAVQAGLWNGTIDSSFATSLIPPCSFLTPLPVAGTTR